LTAACKRDTGAAVVAGRGAAVTVVVGAAVVDVVDVKGADEEVVVARVATFAGA
jgi:hypothetical protein